MKRRKNGEVYKSVFVIKKEDLLKEEFPILTNQGIIKVSGLDVFEFVDSLNIKKTDKYMIIDTKSRFHNVTSPVEAYFNDFMENLTHQGEDSLMIMFENQNKD